MYSLLAASLFGMVLLLPPLLACAQGAESSVQGSPTSGILRKGIRYQIASGEHGDLSKCPQTDWQSEIKIRGTLSDGTVFLDRTSSSNQLTLHPRFSNLEEPLGLQFFPELALIGPGGRITLQLAAERGVVPALGPVPEDCDLIFEIELVSTCDLVAEEKKELAREQTYFAELLKSNAALVTTPSGICYQILAPGGPTKAQRTDVCDIKITVTLADNSPVLTDESVRLYRKFYNSDHALIIKHISELALIGTGGKIRLYIPFNQGFRHYKKPGIPPYSTLIYDVEIQKITEQAAQIPLKEYWPKCYSIYEEYPMLLRHPTDQGPCPSSWALACAHAHTTRLGQALIDVGLTPPAIRTPIVRNNQIIGYEHPTEATLDGWLSAQMLMSLTKQIEGDGFTPQEPLYANVLIQENHLVSSRFVPYVFPTKNEDIPLPSKSGPTFDYSQIPATPGGFSKRISGDFAFMLLGKDEMQQGIWFHGPISGVMNVGLEFEKHFAGVLRKPQASDTEREDSWQAIAVVGWGYEGDEFYWVVENSWGPLYFFDGKGPFSIENFSRGLLKISDRDDYFQLYSHPSYGQTVNIVDDDGSKRNPNYLLDVYSERNRDGFLPWPYLRP